MITIWTGPARANSQPAALKPSIQRTAAFILVVCLLLSGCQGLAANSTPAAGRPAATSTAAAATTATPTAAEGLTADQAASLTSLRQIDPYPLYTMHYVGAYQAAEAAAGRPEATIEAADQPAWACSLFAVLADGQNKLYGRNFDWQYSPALLLFTDPPDGYASVSMVDIAYLGFDGLEAKGIDELPLNERTALLRAPYLPFDGLNEQGLAVGMAAVPPGNMEIDPAKETISSLGVIREILDHAGDVEEAVALFGRYHVDMGGGPALHYLLADAGGQSALVEFHDGEMRVITNDQPWQAATNFLVSAIGSPAGHCARYDTIEQRLGGSGGVIDPAGAMDLLARVAQANTQWSVVYDLTGGQISLAMGGAYDTTYLEHLARSK